MVRSWESKLERAKHHLSDFEALIAPYEGRRAYPVREGRELNDDEWEYVSRIDIPEPADPLLPIIAGDIMSNLRSALDHLAVALSSEPHDRTAFPIFTDDIDAIDPDTGKYLHRKARRKWKALTRGFPEGAMTIIEEAQPYMHSREGRDPQYAALALLSVLQNADKHKRLVLVVSGLRDPIVWFNTGPGRKRRAPLRRVPENRRVGPRTVVGRAREPLASHMNMEAEGTLDIMIGDREPSPEWSFDDPFYSCPFVFESMIRDLDGLIERLDRYVLDPSP